MLNALTIDVEEYFHPSEVRLSIDEWPLWPSRVEPETERILALLEHHRISATFFVLGWVAERNSRLVRSILRAGHEIGCHSYSHRLVYELTPQDFRQDTKRAIACIEDACGVTPRVYRAPSYSITQRSIWALAILAECGFTHDSSIFPVAHDRYGIPGFARHAQILDTPSGPICEVPIATVELGRKRVAPVGGGAYLRLLPYRYTAAGIRRINHHEAQPACIYLHPWELDCDQPRLASGCLAKWRTYAGIAHMHSKVDRLLSEFRFSTITAVHPSPWISEATGGQEYVRAAAGVQPACLAEPA